MSPHRPDSALHPSEGARLLLERAELSDDASRAVYGGTIYTPTEKYAYRVSLCLDGTFTLEALEQAPEELEQRLAMLARLTARGAQKRQDDGLTPWPHRLLRWKGPGRG